MEMDLPQKIAILFALFFLLILFYKKGLRSRKQKISAFSKFSKKIGARFKQQGIMSYPELKALFRGHLLFFTTFVRGAGMGQKRFLSVTLSPIKIPDNIELIISLEKEDSTLSKVGASSEDIQIGEKEFDDRFFIKGSNSDTIKRILSNESLRKIIDRVFLDGNIEELHMGNMKIVFYAFWDAVDDKFLLNVSHDLTDLAEELLRI